MIIVSLVIGRGDGVFSTAWDVHPRSDGRLRVVGVLLWFGAVRPIRDTGLYPPQSSHRNGSSRT
jgi:hypothetical protein